MFITNKEEVISILRSKLDEYLVLHKIKSPNQLRFRCFMHEDKNPSMALNPKSNYEVAHCFACNASGDIFTAAHHIEGLPLVGPEWMTETIPTLAKQLNISIALGEPSPQEQIKADYYRLARDIADLIQHPDYAAVEYTTRRQWTNEYEDAYTVEYDTVIASLVKTGWDTKFIHESKLISIPTEHGVYPLIGSDKVTCIIRDHRSRPVAFISRNLSENAHSKYIHSGESPVFSKRETLLGLDRALKDAKKSGLVLVEGPGDRFQFLRYGMTNVVALCGVALTDAHLNLLKSLGVNTLLLCLDWDEAGQRAVENIINTMAVKKINGFNIKISVPPSDGSKDPDEFFVKNPQARPQQIQFVDIFEWFMAKVDLTDEAQVQGRLIPIIASAPSAMKRDMLATQLANALSVSHASVLHDVDRIRNHSFEERKERLLATANKYLSAIESDPMNMMTALAAHEEEVSNIESEYEKNSIGVNYQLSRFDSIQEQKKTDDIDRSEFNLQVYTEFKQVMSTGSSWTRGAFFIFPGRSNSGKTAVITALGMDALINDQDCIVIAHLTDDNYAMLEPRLVTNVSYILTGKNSLSVGAAACPGKHAPSPEESALYHKALTHLRGLISEERLMILDSEDGNTLSVLEKQLKYARRKYPNKKILILADGCHNYGDFSHLDQTSRIAKIADACKRLVNVYSCCMFATAEYRKNMPLDSTKLKWPVNDDIADSRALMFRAGAIVHVYNDLNDRGDPSTGGAAEIMWQDPFEPDKNLPQLALVFGKNKLSSFKGKLVMNLNPSSVTLAQENLAEAARKSEARMAGLSTTSSGLEIEVEDDEE